MVKEELYKPEFLSQLNTYDSLDILKLFNRYNYITNCSPSNPDFHKNKQEFAKYLGSLRRLDIACIVLNHLNIPMFLLHHYASDFLKEEYLLKAEKAQALGAIGITESSGGSNLLETVEACYRETPSGYILNGNKKYLLNIPCADFIVIFARSESDPDCFSLFLLPINSDNLTIQEIPVVGLDYCHVGQIEMKDCLIKKENLIGREGEGGSSGMPGCVRDQQYGAG